MKADFYITYHHSDEMAARWIAAELKQARFTTLSDSWDFLRGETPLEKIDSMSIDTRFAMILISRQFIEFLGDLNKSFGKSRNPFSKGFLVRIDSCEIEKVLGAVNYLDLAGIKEAEAVKRLLAAVGAAVPEKKETEPLPVAPLTPDEILAKRKQELDQLLESTIKHNYHMKLDLEQEVEKLVEEQNEKTGEMEKRKQWVWEPVPLEMVLKDRKNYILVNPSGMGKTTFLTYVASTLLDRDAHYPFLPLFFTCIGLNNLDSSIENFILHQVESFYTHSQGLLVSRDWENLCVLIDALDQARDVDDIVSSLLLHDKPLHYKKAKIILSSRQNTADKVKEGFEKIRLKLPEADEVQRYLGEENYKKLEGIIASSGELVTAPVLLEMLKTITEKGHVVSTLYNRAGLYTEFTKILLDQERSKPRFWQDKSSIRHFIENELEQALEKIAFFSLVDNEILEIPKEKLAQYCESPEKKEALLNIGIILELFEDREQKIVFRHQSFQAYFAARYIYYRQPELFRQLISDIGSFYNDVWYEVMRFFVGVEKNPRKAEAIIDTIYQNNDNKFDINQALRLIFAVFLLSDARVSIEFVQRVYRQLVNLFKNNLHYWNFFNIYTDKFNKVNNDQRRNLFTIFELLLRDEDKDVSSAATEALENIVTADDIPFLESLLRDKDSRVRRTAALAVNKIGKAENVPLLAPLLRDENFLVRAAADIALINIAKEKDIPLLLQLLRDKSNLFLHETTNALAKISTAEHIPLLEPLLKDEENSVRRNAAGVLGKIGTAEHIPLLETLLLDKDNEVRSAAAKALGEIGTAEHIPLLEPLLRDEHYWVRSAAAKALGNIGTSDHIPLLEPLLRDEHYWVRSAAAKALGNIGTSDHIPILQPLFSDENADVRCAAAEALGNIGTSDHIPIMQSLFSDENANVRSSAAETLGNIGTSDHIPIMQSLFSDENANVRSSAAETLGNIGTIKHINFLIPLLMDKNESVSWAAAYTMAKIMKASNIHLLLPKLRDMLLEVNRTLFESYRKIKAEKDLPLPASLLRNGNENDRCSLAEVLKKIGTSKDIPILEILFRDKDLKVRNAAIEALEKIGTAEHIPLLEPLLRDEHSWIRSAAAKALGKIGAVQNISLLEHLLRDEDTKMAAAKAIEKIYKRSTPKLRIDRVLPTKKEKKVLTVKTFNTQPLHILHISDIHYALEKDPTITCIFHEFLQDIKKWRSQQNNTNIHSICLTGDIAQSGQENQYHSIHEKINTILKFTGCAKENLFIIPGNHDVQDYDTISPQGKTLLEQIRDNKMSIDSHVLSNFDHYRLFHDKFAHYYRFIENAGYLNSLPENHNHNPKPWYNRKLKDFPVRIMGLNSALFCVKDFCQYGNIRMGTHQFHEAFFQGNVGPMPDHELVIFLTHHPLNWLVEKESEDYSTLMERHSIIHLHGHIHKTKIEKKQRLFSSSGGYVSIGTGSLYGEKGTEDINTYHIITLDFEKQELHVWARRWNPDSGKWTIYDDDGNNRFPLPTN